VRSSVDPLLPEQLRERWADTEDDQPIDVIYYQAPVRCIRDRLELLGYTSEGARRLFEEWKQFEVEQQQDWDWVHEMPAAMRRLERLRSLRCDEWIENLQRIDSEQIANSKASDYPDSVLGDMLDGNRSESWYGCSVPDPLVALRLSMEACRDDASMIYDVTDLILSEYLDVRDDPIAQSFEASALDYNSLGRIIILTEGRSDAWILKESITLLFPHLQDYFSFMEFEEFRVGGGAGELAKLVRSFAAAGIINRVIAIFDNDAAAAAAIGTLRNIALPPHIVVMMLPELEALQDYPTIGPTGPSRMDINGMAAGIELYLGSDVLLNDDGSESRPVQWTGYESSVGRYQGEIVGKADVLASFRKKVLRAKTDEAFHRSADWAGLRAVLRKVFTAFHALDQEMCVQGLRNYYGVDGDEERKTAELVGHTNRGVKEFGAVP